MPILSAQRRSRVAQPCTPLNRAAHQAPDVTESSRPVTPVRSCLVCGEPLTLRRSDALTCSGRCRVRLHRKGGVTRSARLAARWGLSARDFWRTPPDLFRHLDAEFGFGLDAAAAGPDDGLCSSFLTPDDDALTCSWVVHCTTGAAFCNPPYSRKGGRGQGLLAWAKKAVAERDAGLTVCLLVPPSPSTRYHQLLKAESVELRLPKKRLAFLHPDTGLPMKGNRGDSMVAVLRPGRRGPAVEAYFDANSPVRLETQRV
jgi:phage N-6-adenine-methyltransferase